LAIEGEVAVQVVWFRFTPTNFYTIGTPIPDADTDADAPPVATITRSVKSLLIVMLELSYASMELKRTIDLYWTGFLINRRKD